MASMVGMVRRRVLAPSLESVRFAARGFPVSPGEVTARLEKVPQAVVCGFEWAIEGASPAEVEHRLALLDAEQRGFGYEGAAMAYTVLDAMPGGRRDQTQRLLRGPGERHIFLAYIGIGFAMARLPRPLWRGVLPDLSGSPYHPTMSWLAVDGYGFDRAYFETRRWVDEQYEPPPYPWDGAPGYFPRAVDQGIGRALWFIHGADPGAVAAAVGRFPARRHGDLWSGVGLAATFAGGCARPGFAELCRRAGEHAAALGLGAVFAAKARDYAGFLPPHTEEAVAVFTGLPVRAVVDIADRTVVAHSAGEAATPAYEKWRTAIVDDLRRTAEPLAG